MENIFSQSEDDSQGDCLLESSKDRQKTEHSYVFETKGDMSNDILTYLHNPYLHVESYYWVILFAKLGRN